MDVTQEEAFISITKPNSFDSYSYDFKLPEIMHVIFNYRFPSEWCPRSTLIASMGTFDSVFFIL